MSTEHILEVYSRATETEVINGKRWYQTANSEARRIAREYGVSLAAACGIIAALSPNNRWERNLRDAETLLSLYRRGVKRYWVRPKGKGFGTYRDNLHKAWRIAAGESPDSVLRGMKVRAFYSLILDPMNPFDVCVDGHAWDIFTGQQNGNLDSHEARPSLDRGNRYQTAASAYRDAAGVLGVLPHQVQAVCWVAWRRIHYTSGGAAVRRYRTQAAAA